MGPGPDRVPVLGPRGTQYGGSTGFTFLMYRAEAPDLHEGALPRQEVPAMFPTFLSRRGTSSITLFCSRGAHVNRFLLPT
jgi:hypothetical protein